MSQVASHLNCGPSQVAESNLQLSLVFCCYCKFVHFATVQVCVYNRTVEKVDEFLKNEAKEARVIGAYSLEEMVANLKQPRRVMLMVKAGQAVDDFITKLVSKQFVF